MLTQLALKCSQYPWKTNQKLILNKVNISPDFYLFYLSLSITSSHSIINLPNKSLGTKNYSNNFVEKKLAFKINYAGKLRISNFAPLYNFKSWQEKKIFFFYKKSLKKVYES